MESGGVYLPKGACLAWDQVQLYLQSGADLLIAATCFFLAFVLIRTYRARPSLHGDSLLRIVYYSHITFHFAIATERLVNISVLWFPIYSYQLISKWTIVTVLMIAAFFIHSTLGKSIARREEEMRAIVANKEEYLRQLTANKKSFQDNQEAIHQDISDLEDLLKRQHETPDRITIDELIRGVREVIADLRSHAVIR